MKMRYEKQVGLMEVFLEAVPTCLVMTILMVTTLGKFLKGMHLIFLVLSVVVSVSVLKSQKLEI